MKILKYDTKKAYRYRRQLERSTKSDIYEVYKKPSQAKIRAFNNIKGAFETRCKLLETEWKCLVYYKKFAILSANTFSFTIGYQIEYINSDYQVTAEYKILTYDNVYAFGRYFD